MVLAVRILRKAHLNFLANKCCSVPTKSPTRVGKYDGNCTKGEMKVGIIFARNYTAWRIFRPSFCTFNLLGQQSLFTEECDK